MGLDEIVTFCMCEESRDEGFVEVVYRVQLVQIEVCPRFDAAVYDFNASRKKEIWNLCVRFS